MEKEGGGREESSLRIMVARGKMGQGRGKLVVNRRIYRDGCGAIPNRGCKEVPGKEWEKGIKKDMTRKEGLKKKGQRRRSSDRALSSIRKKDTGGIWAMSLIDPAPKTRSLKKKEACQPFAENAYWLPSAHGDNRCRKYLCSGVEKNGNRASLVEANLLEPQRRLCGERKRNNEDKKTV